MSIDDQIKIIVDNPDIRRVAIPIIPVNEIVDKLGTYGFIHQDGDGGTNGRDVDFWEYFDHKSLGKFTLQGSLWRGQYQFCQKK